MSGARGLVARWAQRETRAGDRLPYAALLDEHVIELADGALMLALHVPGLGFETADAETLNAHTAQREIALRAVLDSRLTFHHHVIRRRVSPQFPGRFEAPFAAELDQRWRQRLDSGATFVNDQFVTLVRRPPRGRIGWGERIARRLARAAPGRDAPDPAELRALRLAGQALVTAFAPYGARLLGDYDSAGATMSEPLELLSALYNGEMRPVRRPAEGTAIGHYLPYSRVSFGLDALELAGPGGRRFAALLALKDYPDATGPGLTDPLLRLPHELVLSESYAPHERQIARERIDLALRRQRSADEDALAERAELFAARDALGTGEAGFGEHQLTVLVRAATLDALDRAVADCATALADAGAVAVREDGNLELAFWGQFPGNEAMNARRATISSANMACFSALHGFPPGSAEGHHWGPALALLPTSAATPHYLSLHHGDLGNFTLIGPSGTGKTVLLNFLVAQAQRSAPRTVLFDKDRGSEIFVRAMGGRYTRIEPGEPTGFNPLALSDTPANRAFLREWLAVLTAAEGVEEHALLAHAVDAAYANDPALRRLSHFHELLQGTRRPRPGDLAARLAPWAGAGELAWLFDHPRDTLDTRTALTGFDMTALLDAPRLRTATMLYLFHRIEERLNGDPALILIDEGWRALDDHVFEAKIRDWLKTLRKRNAALGFVTQSARDALDSRIAAALVEQTATMLFMPNPRARAEDYCQGFGLSEHELAVIRTLPPQSHAFLVRQGESSAVLRLDLTGFDDLLAVLSGRESSVRRLDRLRAELGDDPEAWYQPLTGAAWPGAPGITRAVVA